VQLTDLERQQMEQVAKFKVLKACEAVRNAGAGAPRVHAEEQLRSVLAQWLPKAGPAQQQLRDEADRALLPQSAMQTPPTQVSENAPTTNKASAMKPPPNLAAMQDAEAKVRLSLGEIHSVTLSKASLPMKAAPPMKAQAVHAPDYRDATGGEGKFSMPGFGAMKKGALHFT